MSRDRAGQRFVRLGGALAVALLVAAAPAVHGQEAPGLFARVMTVQVHLGKDDVYVDLRRRVIAAATERGWSRTVVVSSTLAGEGGQYVVFSLHENLRELIDHDVVTFGAANADPAGWRDRLQQAIQRVDTEIFRMRPDLSGPAPITDLAAVEAWSVVRVRVRTGMAPQYEGYVRAVAEAARQVAPDVRWNTYAPGINTGPVYRISVPLSGDLGDGVPSGDAWLRQVHGAEAAERMIRQGMEAVESSNVVLLRNRPELSYYPPPQE
jgi:hypothetical protein